MGRYFSTSLQYIFCLLIKNKNKNLFGPRKIGLKKNCTIWNFGLDIENVLTLFISHPNNFFNFVLCPIQLIDFESGSDKIIPS